MKALSIRQPWAWLIANDWKNIENRTWPTKFRGRFLIHASSGMSKGEYLLAWQFVRKFAPQLAAKMPEFGSYDLGGIVGQAVILDCVSKHSSEWFEGPFGFVVDEARPLPFSLCKGRLFFFEVDDGR